MERYDLMGIPHASGDRAGILRTANAVDEKNSGCTDAAITPSNLHNVLGYRKANTAYAGNEIVACPYQPGLLLKCTQAGTTSANSLDTTSVTVGQVITDGGVKWEVINPLDHYLLLVGGTMTGAITAGIAGFLKRDVDTANLLITGGATSANNAYLQLYGGESESNTGAFILSAYDANGNVAALKGLPDGTLTWEGRTISNPITGASISGKVITLTFADGTTKTLTTQDTVTTNTSNWTLSKATNGYTRDKSTGFTLVWGTIASINADATATVTFPKVFTNVYGAVLGSKDANSDWNVEISGSVTTTGFTLQCRGKARTKVHYLAYGYCSS